jgi:hypothetical protein
VVPYSSAAEYQRSLSLHTASFLAAAAHCHDAFPQTHPFLRPFSQLHFVPTGPCAAPGISLCASLCRSFSHSNPHLRPLLCLLTPRSSQCQLTLSPGRSVQRVPPFCKRLLSSRLQNVSKPATPHRIARSCSVSNAVTLGITWTPYRSTRIFASQTATSSMVATSALAQLAPTRTFPQPLAFVIIASRAATSPTP